MAIGASFGGDEGRQYIQLLTDTAWWEEPEHAAVLGRSLDAAEAKRGNPKPPPEKPHP
jgi:hypothetical protein